METVAWSAQLQLSKSLDTLSVSLQSYMDCGSVLRPVGSIPTYLHQESRPTSKGLHMLSACPSPPHPTPPHAHNHYHHQYLAEVCLPLGAVPLPAACPSRRCLAALLPVRVRCCWWTPAKGCRHRYAARHINSTARVVLIAYLAHCLVNGVSCVDHWQGVQAQLGGPLYEKHSCFGLVASAPETCCTVHHPQVDLVKHY